MATELKRVNGTLIQTEEDKKYLERVREAGKGDRRKLTDAVQAFNDYVDSEGNCSTMPKHAYTNMTKKIYSKRGLNREMVEARLAGKVGRDVVSDTDLTYIQTAERLVAKLILQKIKLGETRLEIKAAYDAKIIEIAEVFEDSEEEDAA